MSVSFVSSNGIVRLNDRSGHLRGWIDSKAELGLLPVVDGEALEEEGAEAAPGPTPDAVEAEESLQRSCCRWAMGGAGQRQIPL